jgi:hypothetical protein
VKISREVVGLVDFGISMFERFNDIEGRSCPSSVMFKPVLVVKHFVTPDPEQTEFFSLISVFSFNRIHDAGT